MIEGLAPITKIAEGKTKAIWTTQNPGLVIVDSGDAITAGDGAKRDVIPEKAVLATETTVNCFRLLQRHGIRTSFVDRYSDTAFVAHRGVMIPVESVARRLATGSYLKRNPGVVEGTRFDPLVTEMFIKDDTQHDPMIEMDKDEWHLFDAKVPRAQSFLGSKPASWLDLSQDDIIRMAGITREVFEVLEKAWTKHDVTLVDLKIEFDRQLRVSDVIDNDSWRIWPGGDKAQMLDKQNYRDGNKSLDDLKKDYARVARMTADF